MGYLGWIIATLAVGLTAVWAWFIASVYMFLGASLLAEVQGWAVAFGPLVGVLGVIAVGRRFPNRTVLLVCAVLLIGVALVVFGVARDQRLLVDGKAVTLGMSFNEVRAILGRPSWDGPCAKDPIIAPVAGCKFDLIYSSSFAPLYPSYFVINFDQHDGVIGADWMNSP